MKILVTGVAGFIGMHVAKRLLEAGSEVVGVDNLNDYYDVKLKQDRLEQLRPFERFRFVKLDLAEREAVAVLFAQEAFSLKKAVKLPDCVKLSGQLCRRIGGREHEFGKCAREDCA